MNQPLITDNQAATLLLSFATSRGEQGFTEEEWFRICEMVTDILVDKVLIDMVLDRQLDINLNEEGELAYRNCK